MSWVLMPLLLCASGFMSSAETAIFSLQRGERRRLAEQNPALGRLLARPTRLLVMLLLTNLFINVAYFTASASLSLSLSTREDGAWWSAAVAVGSLAALVLLGEILPKTLALQHPVGLVRRVAPLLVGLQKATGPLVALATWATRTLEDLVLGASNEGPRVDGSDFKSALRGTGASYHAVELALLHDVVDFGDRRARHHMVPRVDVAVLDVQDDRETWWRLMARRPHTEYAVVDGSPDHIVGTINTARLFAHPDAPLEDLIETPLFAPVSIAAETLVLRLRSERRHLAILLDEFGGMAGIVGLTQLGQAVLGEVEPLVGRRRIERSGDTLLVRGDMPLSALADEIGIVLPTRRADTLSGALTERLGRVPQRGDEVHLPGWRLRVAAVRRGRVERVVVRPTPTEPAP